MSFEQMYIVDAQEQLIENSKQIDILKQENAKLRKDLEQCKIERMYLNDQLQKIKQAGKAVHNAVIALDVELNL